MWFYQLKTLKSVNLRGHTLILALLLTTPTSRHLKQTNKNLKVPVLKSLENEFLLNWQICLLIQPIYHPRGTNFKLLSPLQAIREKDVKAV